MMCGIVFEVSDSDTFSRFHKRGCYGRGGGKILIELQSDSWKHGVQVQLLQDTPSDALILQVEFTSSSFNLGRRKKQKVPSFWKQLTAVDFQLFSWTGVSGIKRSNHFPCVVFKENIELHLRWIESIWKVS